MKPEKLFKKLGIQPIGRLEDDRENGHRFIWCYYAEGPFEVLKIVGNKIMLRSFDGSEPFILKPNKKPWRGLHIPKIVKEGVAIRINAHRETYDDWEYWHVVIRLASPINILRARKRHMRRTT